MWKQFVSEFGAFFRKWFWCFFWHRKDRCYPEVWKRNSSYWHCSRCRPCEEGLLECITEDSRSDYRGIPKPGEVGYGHWSWTQAMRMIAELRPPDMPVHRWVEMMYKVWINGDEFDEADDVKETP